MILVQKFRNLVASVGRDSGHSRGPYRHSFHRSIFPVLFVTQLFGLFPVQGISGLHTHHLRFKWLSVRTLYCFVTIGLGFTMAGLEIYRLSKTTATAKNLGSFSAFFMFL